MNKGIVARRITFDTDKSLVRGYNDLRPNKDILYSPKGGSFLCQKKF